MKTPKSKQAIDEATGEFVALLKSRPGKLNIASSGVGSASHLAAELITRSPSAFTTPRVMRSGWCI